MCEHQLTGLSQSEAAQRRARGEGGDGGRTITKSRGQIMRENLFTFFNLLNFLIAGLLLAVGAYSNMLFLAIIILNIVIGTAQELKAKKLVDELSLLNRPRIRVLWDAKEQILGQDEIVMGDLMVLLFAEAFFLRHEAAETAVISSAAALLGMLPKGLVLLISVSLAAGSIRLAKMKILVQNIYSLEALAHVDTLCLDKTGTITDGKLNVRSVITLSEVPEEEARRLAGSYMNACQDNNATFQALRAVFQGSAAYVPAEQISFSSKRKWGCISFDQKGTVFVGAPERLLGELPLDLAQALEEGHRMIAVGYVNEVWKDDTKLPEGIQPLYAVVLEDTIRPHTRETLEFFRTEGVDVKVISGDHVKTVSRIAQRAGLHRWKDAVEETAERGELMSLKKRMFRSNMMILFTALFSLMLMIVSVLVFFEDSLENQLDTISETRVEKHAGEVALLIDSGELNTAEELQKEVEKWDYQAAVILNGKVVSGESGEQMRGLAEFFRAQDHRDGQTEVFTFQKATVAGRELEEGEGYLAAAYFPEEDWIASSLTPSFYAFLAAILLAGTGGIILLLLLASVFTRRMNRMVMEPVDLLKAGAERVRDGNLKEDIHYQGEEEFEQVCRTFNDMQHTILEDQEQREKNEQARTDMVTGISHDLRTPLTSVQGYIKGVLDGVADTEEKRKTYLRTAYASTKEMDLLLRKLFDFSRMESGTMPFHMVKVDLAEYAAAYVAQKEAVTDPDELEFAFSSEKEWMPEISLDIEQVRRIFDNLLENSMKYAQVRPVRIDLSAAETAAEILLVWKDNGQGVPEEKLGRIFERFYRCDEARREKGSGVGLYVVKYIMERHGGTIKAENDGGLKLTLAFPKREKDLRVKQEA